jgi:iron complex outermembrane recepter protein
MQAKSLIQLVVAVLCGSVSVANAQSLGNSIGPAAPIRLSVASKPIAAALNDFARQSGLHVVIGSEVAAGVTSTPVEGTFTPEAALQQLLMDTGLRYEYLDAQTVAVLGKDKPKAALDVTATGAALPANFERLRLAEADASSASSAGAGEDNDATSSAAADPTSGTLQEIIVTARKRDERLIDVPETISVFTGDMLEKAGIQSLDDLGRSLTNVVLNRRADNEPNVVIRGIGAFGNVQGVGFYVDDVQNFTDQSARLVDLERVEVLKGPQGTLYGGSSIGGAVKYVTRKPTEDFAAQLGVEIGTRRTSNLNGSVNLPLAENLFLRASAYTDNTRGYMENPITGVNNDEAHEYGARAALRWLPADGTEILASVRHSYLDNGGLSYVATNGNTDYRHVNPLNENPSARRDIWGGTLQIDQQIGATKLTSLTSYTQRRSYTIADLDYTSLEIVSTPHDSKPIDTPVLTQELRLASDSDAATSWLIGVYAADIKDRGAGRGDIILGSAVTGAEPIRLVDFGNTSNRNETYAAFANVAYETGAFEVSVGARWNHNKFTATNFNIPDTLEVEENTVLPKLSVSYKVSPALMLYSSVAKGYEPGRVNFISDVMVPFKAETTKNFELGGKGSAGMLTYEVAAFYIQNDDRQFETQVRDSAGAARDLITNIGDSRSYGVEASLTLRPIDHLIVMANSGYLHARYDHAVFNGVTYDDVMVPYSPGWSGNLSAEYSLALTQDLEINLRANGSYIGEFRWDIPNRYSQDAYAIAGLRVAISSIAHNWELAVRADNLFDQGYNNEFVANYLGDPSVDPNQLNATCDECHLAMPGEPRQVALTFGYKF